MRLPADADGVLERLVGGAAALVDAQMPPWALVGGLAVIIHLAEAHRVTRDVDVVVDDDGRLEPAIEVLVANHAAIRERDRLHLADGTDVDLISIGTWTADALPEDELERMFVLAHWWAMATTAILEVAIVAGDTVIVHTELPVATPAGLVATKLQSLRNRRRPVVKAATDVLDAYRLLVAHDRDGGIATALAAAPGDLSHWAIGALRATFVEDAARWARRVNSSLHGSTRGEMSARDLDVVGSLCAERLGTLLESKSP